MVSSTSAPVTLSARKVQTEADVLQRTPLGVKNITIITIISVSSLRRQHAGARGKPRRNGKGKPTRQRRAGKDKKQEVREGEERRVHEVARARKRLARAGGGGNGRRLFLVSSVRPAPLRACWVKRRRRAVLLALAPNARAERRKPEAGRLQLRGPGPEMALAAQSNFKRRRAPWEHCVGDALWRVTGAVTGVGVASRSRGVGARALPREPDGAAGGRPEFARGSVRARRAETGDVAPASRPQGKSGERGPRPCPRPPPKPPSLVARTPRRPMGGLSRRRGGEGGG